jgi:hypothetical protein
MLLALPFCLPLRPLEFLSPSATPERKLQHTLIYVCVDNSVGIGNISIITGCFAARCCREVKKASIRERAGGYLKQCHFKGLYTTCVKKYAEQVYSA